MATFGLTTGTILTSGSVTNATPPTGGSTNNGFPGDPTMQAAPWTGTVNDACAIVFDIVPSCDSIKFNYVFGSNEYPVFIANYADGFAAFIQGPGYPTFTNIALLPNNTPVSVINVFNNAAFFQGNPGGTGYSGRSNVLTGIAGVQPCQTYTLKFVVADEQDFIVDSGVFLEAVTCGTDPPYVLARNVNNLNSPEAPEDCVDGLFTFFSPGNNSVPTIINFTILGTAINGTDYGTLPTSVTIPAGQDSVNLLVSITSDGLVEGPETIIIAMNALSCQGDTATLTILDPFETNAGPDQGVCSGQPAILGGVPDPNVTYAWQNNVGFQGPANSANPTASLLTTIHQSFNYVLTATDQNGCQDSDTVKIDFVPLPQAGFYLPPEVCVSDVVTITFTKPPVPGLTYHWDFGTNIGSQSGSGQGPYVISWSQAGVQTISLYVVDQSCNSDTIYQTITVHPIPNAFFTATSPVCANQPALVNYVGSAGNRS